MQKNPSNSDALKLAALGFGSAPMVIDTVFLLISWQEYRNKSSRQKKLHLHYSFFLGDEERLRL